MKLSKRLFTICISVFFFLFFPVYPLADTNNLQHENPNFRIQVKDRVLTIHTKDIPLEDVLNEIACQTSINVIFLGSTGESISIDLDNIPLDEGLRRLIRGNNYAFIYRKTKKSTEPELDTIVISPKSTESRIYNERQLSSIYGEEILDEGKERIIRSLLEKLKDVSPLIRENTITHLSEYKDERVFMHLTEILLSDDDEDVRAKAAKALGNIGDKRAIDPLLIALEDRESWVREKALDALAQIGEERVLSSIMTMRRDDDEDVRSAANNAIEKISKHLGI